MPLHIPKADIIIRPLFAHELENYFKIRYQSAQKHHPRLLNGLEKDKLEIDMFDCNSVHIGSFLEGELIGCIRFTLFPEAEGVLNNLDIKKSIRRLAKSRRQRDKTCWKPSLPSSVYLESSDRFVFENYLKGLLGRGKKISEIGRLINLKEGNLFKHLLEMINYVWAYYLSLGVEYCFFNCSSRHAAYYSRQIGGKRIFQHINFGINALSPRSMLEVKVEEISRRCKKSVERNYRIFQQNQGPCPIHLTI